MGPQLGVPDVEELTFASEDESWSREWLEFSGAISAADGRPFAGDLDVGSIRLGVHRRCVRAQRGWENPCLSCRS